MSRQEKGEYAVPQIRNVQAGALNPHQGAKKHQNRHFENQAETSDNRQKPFRIFPNLNPRLEALAVAD
jgi:hypothetical protein